MSDPTEERVEENHAAEETSLLRVLVYPLMLFLVVPGVLVVLLKLLLG